VSIRDHALAALADQEAATVAAAEARRAAVHARKAAATRAFFAKLGTNDVVVNGGGFTLPDEGFKGTVTDERATVRWWCQDMTINKGGTYDSVEFFDLPSLGRALMKIDHAKATGKFFQQEGTP
jgi:hypothetical protein